MWWCAEGGEADGGGGNGRAAKAIAVARRRGLTGQGSKASSVASVAPWNANVKRPDRRRPQKAFFCSRYVRD